MIYDDCLEMTDPRLPWQLQRRLQVFAKHWFRGPNISLHQVSKKV